MHLRVDSANSMDFSVNADAPYDETIERFCGVAPAIARVDMGLAEMYDGDLSSEPAQADIQRCLDFTRWGLAYDLQSHGDWFEYIHERQ